MISMLRTNMNWDQHQSLALVAEFKKHEILWNPKHKSFFNSIEKDKAWKQLAETFNSEVVEVKRKIDSLRGSYRREKSRTKARKSESGREGEFENLGLVCNATLPVFWLNNSTMHILD